MSFFERRGKAQVARLDLADRLPIEESFPWRQPRAYRKRRGMVGRFWFSKTDMHLVFESHLEMHHLLELDFDLEVRAALGQPFRFNFEGWTHVPDLFARLTNGLGRVYDVKPADEVELEENRRVFEAAAKACSVAGWDYRVVSEVPDIRLANLMALASARAPVHDPFESAGVLIERCAEPCTIEDLLEGFDWPAFVRPVLLHLLWRQVLATEIDSRLLDRDSVVRLGPVPE